MSDMTHLDELEAEAIYIMREVEMCIRDRPYEEFSGIPAWLL